MKQYLLFFSLIVGLVAHGRQPAKNASSLAYVSVKAEGLQFHNNELSLHLFENSMFSAYPLFKDESLIIKKTGKNNLYQFVVPVENGLDYFSITANNQMEESDGLPYFTFFPTLYLIQPGDNVTITIKPGNGKKGSVDRFALSFSGRGSAKLQCVYDMEHTTFYGAGESTGVLLDGQNVPYPNYWADMNRNKRWEILEKYKTKLPVDVYQQLQFDAGVNDMDKKYVTLRNIWLKAKKNPGKRDSLKVTYQKYLAEGAKGTTAQQLQSPYYPMYAMEKLNCDYLIQENGKGGASKMYGMILNRYSGELRQKMISKFLLYNVSSVSQFDSILLDATAYTKEEPYSQIIQGFIRNISGKPAHPFALKDPEGNTRRLSDFAGKVVFIDFWFTGCGPCSEYFKNVIRPAEEEFKTDTNVVFLSVNVDASKEKWLKGLTSGDYTSSTAVNLFTNGEGTNHDLIKNYKFESVGFPQQLLIDRQGKLVGGYNIRKKETLMEAIHAVRKKG